MRSAPDRPLDHLPLAGAPSDPAIILNGGATVSFAEFERLVGRLAAWLLVRVPQPDSRIAIWLPKGLLATIMPIAVARAGHVHVPVNPLLKPHQVGHILADSGAALLIAQRARLDLLAGDDVPAGCLCISDDDPQRAIAQDEAGHVGPGSADRDRLCQILYTSGSTGRPKGVMLSHANLMLGAQAVANYLDLKAADRTLCVLPFSFDYGQNQLFSTWMAGGAVVPFDYLLPRDVPRAVARYGITTLAGVPPLWVQLTEVDWPADAVAALRRITNSGGALTSALIDRLRALLPATDIYAMYGLTEAFRSTYLPPEMIALRPGSIGRAIPHAEILVVRPDGTLTADDEPGELVHCGPLVAQGYWQDAARTAERFRPAPALSRYGGIAVWSGDTVRRDADGLLYFVGRDDAMIKSAGNRISPTEIEEVAMQVSGIAEAVALGVPDARLGQAIMLFVRADGDGALAALPAALRADLPAFMQPRTIIARDALPRTPNGKIDRIALLNEVPA